MWRSMGSQSCHLRDNPNQSFVRKCGFRVHSVDPPRILALVEEPDDGGFRPPLLEGQWRHDRQVRMKCPAFSCRVHDVEHLADVKLKAFDLALKSGRGFCRDQFGTYRADNRKSGPPKRVLDFAVDFQFRSKLFLIATEIMVSYLQNLKNIKQLPLASCQHPLTGRAIFQHPPPRRGRVGVGVSLLTAKAHPQELVKAPRRHRAMRCRACMRASSVRQRRAAQAWPARFSCVNNSPSHDETLRLDRGCPTR